MQDISHERGSNRRIAVARLNSQSANSIKELVKREIELENRELERKIVDKF